MTAVLKVGWAWLVVGVGGTQGVRKGWGWGNTARSVRRRRYRILTTVHELRVGLDRQERGLQVCVEGVIGIITNEGPESGVYGERTTSSKSVTE
jgi:hypothetical protein